MVYSQVSGGLRGTIIDADFSVPVTGAAVVIEGAGLSGISKEDGSFFINNLPPGQYTVLISKDGFIRERKSSIVISSGAIKDLELEMTAEVVELDEFVVTAEEVVDTVSTTGAITLRSELKSFTEVLGAQFISQTGASDAAKLLSKSTGINVSEGKFVVVRGLADRYNSVTLNGLRVPSSDPDRRAVALDLFPSAVIRDVRTSKTFLPDQPGESTGANINIVTKSVPTENFFKFKVGNGYNSNATGNSRWLTYLGGGTGFLGTGEQRQLPTFLRNTTQLNFGFVPAGTPSDNAQERAARQRANVSLSKILGTTEKAAPVDFTLEASLGMRVGEFMGAPAGLTVAIDYSKKYGYNDNEQQGRYGFNSIVDSPTGGEVQALSRFSTLRVGTETLRAGALVSLGLELDDESTITATYFFNRSAEDRASLMYSINQENLDDPTSEISYRESLFYTERSLRVFQIEGKHKIHSIREATFDWAVSYNQSSQLEPDSRFIATKYQPTNTSYGLAANANVPPFQRYWRELNDQNYNMRFDLETDVFEDLPEDLSVKLKIGGSLDYSDRKFRSDSFAYSVGSLDNAFGFNAGASSQTWGDVFLQRGRDLNSASGISDATHLFRQNDVEAYSANQAIAASYLMFDVDLSKSVNFVFGARLESTDFNVKSTPIWQYLEEETRLRLLGPNPSLALQRLVEEAADGDLLAQSNQLLIDRSQSSIQQVSLLPAMSMNWEITDTQRVRASISRTIARPSFKEIAPIAFINVETGDYFVGNKDLKISDILNYDARWEWFPEPGSVLAVSAFSKLIKNPIEYSAVGNYISYINVPEGSVYGFELEFQRSLEFITDELKPFSVGVNYSYIKSQASRNRNDAGRIFGFTRRLQGQPDYIYNFNFTYDNKESGIFSGLFLNTVGPQLFAVSTTSTDPDIFQKPFTTLDFALSKQLSKNCKLTFRAVNLLNPRIDRFYNNKGRPLFSSREMGINYSLSLNMDW